MTAQTMVEKVAQRHLADGPPTHPVRAGDVVTVRPRHVLTHDNSAAVISKFRGLDSEIADPHQPVFVLDHEIQNRSEETRAKYAAIERFATDRGIDFHPAGTGIGHQVMVERQYALPGALVVASDSHANMYGGVGAIGTPVVRTDAAVIWATGSFWWQVPSSVRVALEGALSPGVSGKDVIITLCALFGQEVLNTAVEFAGPGVASLAIDDRLAIANMTTEWGALVGWFPVDETTVAFERRRAERLAEDGIVRVDAEVLDGWAVDPPRPDPGASYAATIRLDLSRVVPHVSGPDSVKVATPVTTIEGRRIKVDKAYLVSCVNGRAADIAVAAGVLRGRQVKPGVELYIAAASAEQQQVAALAGDWSTLLEAGASPLPPGCGPCIGLGAGLLEPGEVGISATNRNFKGRMGSRDASCYLASPAVVAASAVAGYICAPDGLDGSRPPRWASGDPPRPARLVTSEAPTRGHVEATIIDRFPRRIEGRMVHLPADDLNTDGIYAGAHTYREGMAAEQMAAVVFENYDPTLNPELAVGDVIVAGERFGTGSSREQAATALQARGVAAVVAASFSATYLRNAFNNGLLCVACPDLAADLGDAAGARWAIPGDALTIDFDAAAITYGDERFAFVPPGEVQQRLVVAGGVEALTRQRGGNREPRQVDSPSSGVLRGDCVSWAAL